VKPLKDQQPQDDLSGVQAVVALHAGLFQCFIEKLCGEKLLELRRKADKGGIRKRVEGELRALVFASSYLKTE
jgi:hypothetical protein